MLDIMVVSLHAQQTVLEYQFFHQTFKLV